MDLASLWCTPFDSRFVMAKPVGGLKIRNPKSEIPLVVCLARLEEAGVRWDLGLRGRSGLHDRRHAG
jgi:hypothetical protein